MDFITNFLAEKSTRVTLADSTRKPAIKNPPRCPLILQTKQTGFILKYENMSTIIRVLLTVVASDPVTC